VKERALAARSFVLPVEQIRYYTELTGFQKIEAGRYWGTLPAYTNYIYAVKRDGSLVWDRKRIEELYRYR